MPMISPMSMKPLFTRFALAAAIGLAGAGLRAAPDSGPFVPDSLELKDAIAFALGNNFTIRQARERIRQQTGVEIQVRARQIPNVSASGSDTANSQAISQYIPPTTSTWTIALQARQVLYAGGGVTASIKGARLTREAAELELEGIINQQLLAVRTQFYTVLLGKEKITVQEENVRLLEKQLVDAQNRFNAGSTSNFDVLRAQVALANGQPPLIQARNDYRIAIEQLRQVLGFVSPAGGAGATKVPEFSGSLAVGEPVKIELTAALEAAHAGRPELQRLARLEQAGEQNITANRAGYLPEFDLVGGYLWMRNPYSAAWNDNLHGWTAGVQGQRGRGRRRKTQSAVLSRRSGTSLTAGPRPGGWCRPARNWNRRSFRWRKPCSRSTCRSGRPTPRWSRLGSSSRPPQKRSSRPRKLCGWPTSATVRARPRSSTCSPARWRSPRRA